MELKEFLQYFKTYTYDNLVTLEEFLNLDNDYFEMSMEEIIENSLELNKSKKYVGYYRYGFTSYSEEDILKVFTEHNYNISLEEIKNLLTLL